MGISIHYSGNIKKTEWIPELTEEVDDVCKSMKWKATRMYFNEARVNGIIFAPRKSELVSFTFTRHGRLISPHGLMDLHIRVSDVLSDEHSYICHTKTSWAGPDVHLALIEFIRYITGKYFETFTLYDEAMFWETNDRKKLFERFDAIDEALEGAPTTLLGKKRIRRMRKEAASVRIEQILKEKCGQAG